MKKSNKVVTIILIIVYFISVGVLIYVTPKYNEEDYIKKENDYKVVEINNLNEKISKLDFKNKNRDDYKKGSYAIKSNIFNGKVTITMTINDKQVKYIVSSIDDVISTKSNISYEGSGKQITYILTKGGKVYKIVDDFKKALETEEYKGNPKDMGIVNAESIAVSHDEFSVYDKAVESVPCVYIKASEGRIFTDETGSIKEVIEKVIEKEKK